MSPEIAFCVGVINVVFSTWIVSSCPWNYFLWHSAKNCLMIVIRYNGFRKIKWSLFLLDFCYVVNYLTFLYFGLCVARANVFNGLHALTPYGPTIFRVLFQWATGPLALSVALFRNSLVFNSFDHICILAVHIGPPITVWSMRWYGDQLMAAWPDTFHTACTNASCEATSTELLLQPWLAYLALWSVPYAALLFVFMADKIKKEGLVTMYSYYEKTLFRFDEANPHSPSFEKLKPVIYMAIHAAGVFVAICISQIMWYNFYLHTGYLLMLFLISTYNGGTFYFQVMKKHFLKQHLAEQEVEAKRVAETPREDQKMK